jgi:hypothetical protein
MALPLPRMYQIADSGWQESCAGEWRRRADQRFMASPMVWRR